MVRLLPSSLSKRYTAIVTRCLLIVCYSVVQLEKLYLTWLTSDVQMWIRYIYLGIVLVMQGFTGSEMMQNLTAFVPTHCPFNHS